MKRVIRPQARVFPPNPDLREDAAQDPTSQADQQGLASIAFLANVNPTNTAISQFLGTLNNSAYANSLRGAR